MATRKLGGGRILGSGKSLAPPAPAHQRTNSLLTPSESSVSVASDNDVGSGNGISPLGTSPIPDLQDITSRVNLDRGAPAAAATGKLVCPICNEEMVSNTAPVNESTLTCCR